MATNPCRILTRRDVGDNVHNVHYLREDCLHVRVAEIDGSPLISWHGPGNS